MTREEAKSCIGTIEMLQRLAYNIHGVMDVIDADNCKKIIKALEQEPCEDAISRYAVLEYIEASDAELGHSTENELVCQDIKEFPSVVPKPKTGHWIAVENDEMETVGYYCSECDLPMETEYRTKFCPNCGKKMEVNKNEQNNKKH